MTEFDNLILLVVSGYLLVGYLIYQWITWLLRRGQEWTDDDRETYDHPISMVTTMLLWPKVLLPPLFWFIIRLVVGIFLITLGHLRRLLRRK